MMNFAALAIVTLSWTHNGLNTDGSIATLIESRVEVLNCTTGLVEAEHLGDPAGPVQVEQAAGTTKCYQVRVVGDNGNASDPSSPPVEKVIPPDPVLPKTILTNVYDRAANGNIGKIVGKIALGVVCGKGPVRTWADGKKFYEVPVAAVTFNRTYRKVYPVVGVCK